MQKLEFLWILLKKCGINGAKDDALLFEYNNISNSYEFLAFDAKYFSGFDDD